MPKDLDAYIENARQQADVPGIAVTIVKDGRLVVAKGYGVRELGKDAKVDEETMFDIASLSKSFTTAAIAKLVEEGKMRWDDPVRRHLPTFELADPYRTQNATIRDLLSHRLGLEQGNFMFRFTKYDTAEVIRRMRYLEEREPFRTGFIYSNVAYTAAGEAAAAAAHQSWPDLIRTRLLEPLGMRESTVGVEHTLAPNHASPHALLNGVQQPIRNHKAMNIFPANGVNSNARDIAKWLLFQLGDGKPILTKASMDEMHSPQNIIPTTPGMRAARGVRFFGAYGLGWQIMDFHGHPMLWHSGGADGMPVYMAILPEDQIGVAVMLNTWSAATLHGAIAARILDTYLGTPNPRDWVKESLPSQHRDEAQPDEPRVAGTSPSRPIDAYAATYDNPLHGAMDIRFTDGKLTLQFGGGEIADLEHWNYDTFRVKWHDRAYMYFDTYATFTLDAKGTPVRFEMPLGRDKIIATHPVSSPR
ncbi:MAG TPA: serine hydrolase [Thermoanaerobaculia bacterium]|nr:serine hydrolase [Thermoanaerobaculia bacterium]